LLYIEEGLYQGTQIRFKNILIVGSGELANLKLDEQDIAPLHTAFIKGNDGFYLINLDENNQLSVNGQPVEYTRLNHEDVIAISQNCVLKFFLEDEESKQAISRHENNAKKQKLGKYKNKVIAEHSSSSAPAQDKNQSKISKIVAIFGWFILILLVFISSFICGIYTTDIILKA
ncbi:MAG: FHA domain-containing protein, partial [Planctomycetota bacterium]